MTRICFVCLGNICRSPTAEGVMLHLIAEAGLQDRIGVDSAGTSGYHEGERADSRSRATARTRGFEMPSRSRKFLASDFQQFDYIVAMDQSNLRQLHSLATSEADRNKLSLLRDHDPRSPKGAEVPDPYYGGNMGFETVLDICQAGCIGLLDHILKEA